MKKEKLEIKKLTKYINNSPAINNLSFILYENEILGLSGKSNSGIPELIDILTGKSKPDNGYIYLNDEKVLLNSNFDIQSSGITVISNDSMLFPNFSVEDNIAVNWMTMKNKFIVRKKIFRAISRDILDKYNILIDPKSKVKDLNQYEQSLLQILISYLHGAKVIILYDLIRSFTKPQWLNTLQLVNQLRCEGLSFIVISYDYKLLKICDRIMILRNGCNGVQREHNKKLNNGLPILHKVPPKRDYGRYFCILAEKGGTSHGGLTEKLSPFFTPKNRR